VLAYDVATDRQFLEKRNTQDFDPYWSSCLGCRAVRPAIGAVTVWISFG